MPCHSFPKIGSFMLCSNLQSSSNRKNRIQGAARRSGRDRSTTESLVPSIAPTNRKRRNTAANRNANPSGGAGQRGGDSRKRQTHNAIKEIYLRLRRRHLLAKWDKVRHIYRANDQLITSQLIVAKQLNWQAKARADGDDVGDHELGGTLNGITPPVLAAPIEIPQLYCQMGRFEAKINGRVARVGISMIPPVRFDHYLTGETAQLRSSEPRLMHRQWLKRRFNKARVIFCSFQFCACGVRLELLRCPIPAVDTIRFGDETL